jgi:MFS family permease
MSTLPPAFLAILGMGICTGSVYVLGFTILHETVEDDLRGRTFSALYTLVRFCLLLAFVLGPLLSGVLNRFSIRVFDGSVEILTYTISLPGVRLTLWLAGAIIVFAGCLAISSLRAASATGRTRDL